MKDDFERGKQREGREGGKVNPEAPDAKEISAHAREIREIASYPEQSETRARHEIDELRKRSGLSPRELARIERDTRVNERLLHIAREQQQLSLSTLAKIQAAVDMLAGDHPREQREWILQQLGVGEQLGVGAFYQAHGLEHPEGGDQPPRSVWKYLRLNYLFSARDAVRMLARHEIEADRMKEYFGDMVPDYAFVYPRKHAETFEQEKKKMGRADAKLYDLPTFMRIQMDRRLQAGYARRDAGEKRKGSEVFFGKVGEWLSKNNFFRKECAGVMIQERVHGMTFQNFFDTYTSETCPNYEKLRASVKQFIDATRKFHEKYALLWHRFDSDNVVIETDEKGEPTGRIRIIDLNFTEKSAEAIRKKLVRGFEQRMLKPLEEHFGLSDVK